MVQNVLFNIGCVILLHGQSNFSQEEHTWHGFPCISLAIGVFLDVQDVMCWENSLSLPCKDRSNMHV